MLLRVKFQIEEYLLPCLNKKLFGVECFGCGFQRALVHLIQGDFIAAFKIYPAVYTLIIFVAFAILHSKFKYKYGRKIILALAIINVLIIVSSYFIKMNN